MNIRQSGCRDWPGTQGRVFCRLLMTYDLGGGSDWKYERKWQRANLSVVAAVYALPLPSGLPGPPRQRTVERLAATASLLLADVV